MMQAWHGLIKSRKVWRLDIFSNNKCTHVYGIRNKWSYYFMFITAYCLVLIRIKLMKYVPLFRNI